MNIFELITARRTIRKFSDRPLTREQVVRYVDAARVAPSAANMQPLKYAVITEKDRNEQVFATLKWAGYLKGAYDPKEGECPAGYIVVCADADIRDNNCDWDVGAAVENIILCALSEGVGSCWLASVDREALANILSLPGNLRISSVVALGYPAEAPTAVPMQEGDVKYYLEDGVLNVPKRSLDEVLINVK